MKHVLRLAVLSLLAVASFGAAQTDSHDVTVRIPSVLQLRIIDGTGNNAAANPAIEFDFQAAANINTYLNAVNAGGGNLAPTLVTTFDDIKVFSNKSGAWNVNVSATALAFTNNLTVTGATGVGVALADIEVTPSGATGSGVTVPTAGVLDPFDLSGATVASGTRTTGWSALGISGTDYALVVNGDEDPGQYTTVVTYTITAP